MLPKLGVRRAHRPGALNLLAGHLNRIEDHNEVVTLGEGDQISLTGNLQTTAARHLLVGTVIETQSLALIIVETDAQAIAM